MSAKAASDGLQGQKRLSDTTSDVAGPLHTTKSWKSIARDRFKHSHAGASVPVYRHGPALTLKKGGGGGKFTAGKPVESESFEDLPLDPHDPNYDEAEVLKGLPPDHFAPSSSRLHQFGESVEQYLRFKTHVVTELEVYFASVEKTNDIPHSAHTFAISLKDLDLQQFHSDFCYLVIRWDIESDTNHSAKQRERIVKLIKYLHDHNGCLLTPAQIDGGLRKLYNTLDDLLLQYPHARTVLHEYVVACEGAGITENTWADELEPLEQQAEVLHDQQTDTQIKEKITKILETYLKTEDLDKLAQEIEKLNAPQLHFEIVKIAITMGLDRGKQESELMSELLAAYTGQLISYESTQKGIIQLLEKTEEIAEEYTNVLMFLSCFVARSVADHVFPLGMLNLPDLVQRHLAAQIVSQAIHLLHGPGAAAKLQKVWTITEPLTSPKRKVSTCSGSSSAIGSPVSLGQRKVSGIGSASGSPTIGAKKLSGISTGSPTVGGRKASSDNPFGGFVIGAKKPGTAAYEIEQAKKSTPDTPSRSLGKEASNGETQVSEKERLDTFGYYDPAKSKAAKNSAFAARARYM